MEIKQICQLTSPDLFYELFTVDVGLKLILKIYHYEHETNQQNKDLPLQYKETLNKNYGTFHK
jgi:hypothetical protein